MRTSFMFRGITLPPDVIDSIQRYVKDRAKPSHFLEAVITNNLTMDIARADSRNQDLLPAIVMYLYCEVPSNCWGSREKYHAWMQGGDALPALRAAVRGADQRAARARVWRCGRE